MELKFWRDCVFVNGERLRCDISNFAAYKHILGQAQRLGLEKILFGEGLSREEAIRFFAGWIPRRPPASRAPTMSRRSPREDFAAA